MLQPAQLVYEEKKYTILFVLCVSEFWLRGVDEQGILVDTDFIIKRCLLVRSQASIGQRLCAREDSWSDSEKLQQAYLGAYRTIQPITQHRVQFLLNLEQSWQI